jgi:hypothetical protein
MIHASFAIMRLFPQSLHHFQHTFANAEYDTVYHCCKIPYFDFRAHHKTFVSTRCHLQNGIHVVYPLQSQMSGSQRVLDLGCEQDGKEQTTTSVIASCVQTGVKPGIVV